MATAEMTDEQVFGAGGSRELSDAEVFGGPAPRTLGLGDKLRVLAADFLSPITSIAREQRRQAQHGVMADYAPGGPKYEAPSFSADVARRTRALTTPDPAMQAEASVRARATAPTIAPTDAPMPGSGGYGAAVAAAPAQAFRNLAGSGAGLTRALAEAAGLDQVAAFAAERGRDITRRDALAASELSDRGAVSPRTVMQGAGQALAQAPSLGASIAAKVPFAVAGVPGFAAPVAGQAYQKAREEGLQPLLAALYGTSQGAVELVTELPVFNVLTRMPLPKMVEVVGGDPAALGKLAKYYAAANGIELATEELSTVGAWLIDKATADPTASLERLGADLKQTAAQMAVQAPAMAGMGHAMRRAPGALRAIEARVAPGAALGRALDESVASARFVDPARAATAQMRPRGELSDTEVFGPAVPGVIPPDGVTMPARVPPAQPETAPVQARAPEKPLTPKQAIAALTPDVGAIFDAAKGRAPIFDTIERAQRDLPERKPVPPQAEAPFDLKRATQALQADPTEIFARVRTRPPLVDTIENAQRDLPEAPPAPPPPQKEAPFDVKKATASLQADPKAIFARVMGRAPIMDTIERAQRDMPGPKPAPEISMRRRRNVALPEQADKPPPLFAASRQDQGPVLQNRDRSSDASIAQMNAIAADPDPARLSISRTMDSGAPMVFANADQLSLPPGTLGREDVAVDATGRRVSVRYAVLDADQVIASHRADGAQRPDYASGDQPGLIRAINNGRTAGIQEAYRRGTAQRYREGIAQDAQQLGIDPQAIAGMRSPMLVRVMKAADVSSDIADRSNAPQVASLSAVEQAANDARRITLAGLGFNDDGSPSVEALQQFVQSMPAQEQAQLAPNGVPTTQAADRLLGAVFSQAYGPRLTELYAQARDPEARGVLRALAMAAPDMAALEGAGEYDVRDAVRDAAEAFVSGRRRGIRSADIAAQADLTLSADARSILELLGRTARQPRAIGAALSDAARFGRTQAEAPVDDLFGAVPRAGRDAVIRRIRDAGQDETSVGDTGRRGPADATARGREGRATEPGAQFGDGDLQGDRAARRAQSPDAADRGPERAEPAGIERHVRQQLDLFVDAGPLFSGSDRPDAGDRGEAARRSAARAVESWHLRSPGAVLARSIAVGLVNRGRASLEGQRIESPEDLARLAQIYRDPRFETLRYFLTDDSGLVSSQFGVSTRMPTETTAFVGDPAWFMREIAARMKATGATGYYLLHNHPSGMAVASRADIALTQSLYRALPGFKGHVIIDHNKYAVIGQGPLQPYVRNAVPIAISKNDPLRNPATGLGYKITSPEVLAQQGIKLARADAPLITLIGVDAQMGTVAIGEVPIFRLRDEKLRQWTLRRWALHTGSVNVFAASAVEHEGILSALGRERLVRDAIAITFDDTSAPASAVSLAKTGRISGGNTGIYPDRQTTRITSDTSPGFESSYEASMSERSRKRPAWLMREDAPRYGGETPERKRGPAGDEAVGFSKAIRAYLDSQRTAIPDSKRVGHVNYDKINSPEEAKLALAKLSDAYAPMIAQHRRSQVSVEATARLADMLGQSPAAMGKLLGRKIGDSSNAHELVARASLLEGSAEHLAKLMDEVAKHPTEENAQAMIAQVERSAMMSAQFLGAAAEAGRALNILRSLGEATKRAEKLRATAELIKDWGGLDNIHELANRIQQYDTPQQLLEFARQQAKAHTPSMWIEAWKAGLLSGPRTHLANILSNTLTLGLRIPEKAVTAVIGKLHGGEKAYLSEAIAEAVGLVMGLKGASKSAWETLRTGEIPTEDKAEVRAKAITGANLGLTGNAAKAADVAGEMIRTPFRFLAAEDAFFKELNRQMTGYALATRQAIKERAELPFDRIIDLTRAPSPEMLERADADALYFTFNKDLGPAGAALQRLLNTGVGHVFQFVIPFVRTPTNIVKFAGERTPFAVLSKNVRADLAAGGVTRDEMMAKMAIGTAIGLTAFSFAVQGLLSGGGPPESELKRAQRERGWQAYSIKVDDTWYAYNRLEPLGMLLGIVADGAEVWDYLKQDDREKLASMIAIAFAQNITSKTWLRGVSDLVNALSDPGRYGDRYLANMIGTLIPASMAQMTQARDPIVRETENMAPAEADPLLRETADFVAKLKSRTPGLSEELPPRLDTWGEPIRREGGLGGSMSPIATSREKADPVRDEVARLKIKLSLPEGRAFDVKLSPELREKYGSMAGRTAHEILSTIVTSEGYQKLPDWVRKDVIKEVVTDVRSGARDMLVPDIGPERIIEQRMKKLRGVWEKQPQSSVSPRAVSPLGRALVNAAGDREVRA